MPANVRQRRLAVLVAALCASWALALLVVPTASAHTELIASDPADGAVLQSAPAAVTLTFSEELVGLQPVLLVTGPDGQANHAGEPRLDAATLAIDVAPLTVPGVYSVAYRVVSADGHPVEGQISFTLDQPAAAGTTPPTAAAISPPGPANGTATTVPIEPTQPTGLTSAVAPPTSATVSTTDADVAATSTSNSGTSGWLWAAVIAAAALASAGGVVVARRRARRA